MPTVVGGRNRNHRGTEETEKTVVEAVVGWPPWPTGVGLVWRELGCGIGVDGADVQIHLRKADFDSGVVEGVVDLHVERIDDGQSVA